MLNEMIQTAPLVLALIVMGSVLVPTVLYLIVDSASLSRRSGTGDTTHGVLDTFVSVLTDGLDSDD